MPFNTFQCRVSEYSKLFIPWFAIRLSLMLSARTAKDARILCMNGIEWQNCYKIEQYKMMCWCMMPATMFSDQKCCLTTKIHRRLGEWRISELHQTRPKSLTARVTQVSEAHGDYINTAYINTAYISRTYYISERLLEHVDGERLVAKLFKESNWQVHTRKAFD